jgi:hypothetical protein
MDLPPANGAPSEHQRQCIERMLQTSKFNIIQNLLAWKIHFTYRDALSYVHSMNSNEIPAPGLDVFGPFRLYSTFDNDQRDCLASLADVPFQTVERWIRESGKHVYSLQLINSDQGVEVSSTILQAPLHNVNAHPFLAANYPSASERFGFAGPTNSYASRQLTTNLRRPGRVKVEKGYFKQDCPTCFEKGFDPKSKKQLRNHLKMEKHSKEYRLRPMLDGVPDRYHCCSTDFGDEDFWANHVVDVHCRPSDISASLPLSRTRSSASPQGVSNLRSISGRYAAPSSYQGTPGSAVIRDTIFSSTGSYPHSSMSKYHEGSPKPLEIPGPSENTPAPTSQPHIHLEPSYSLQDMASLVLSNEQLPPGMDSFGNYLFDGKGNNILRNHEGFLVCDGRTGPIPVFHEQPVFAYEDSGEMHNYLYGTTLF